MNPESCPPSPSTLPPQLPPLSPHLPRRPPLSSLAPLLPRAHQHCVALVQPLRAPRLPRAQAACYAAVKRAQRHARAARKVLLALAQLQVLLVCVAQRAAHP
eukprot:361974-Chlamydomonas_euryale.AAC.1